jgi:hypothetical protein
MGEGAQVTKIYSRIVEVTKCSECPNVVGNCGKDFCAPAKQFCTILPSSWCPLPDKPMQPTPHCGHPENLSAIQDLTAKTPFEVWCTKDREAKWIPLKEHEEIVKGIKRQITKVKMIINSIPNPSQWTEEDCEDSSKDEWYSNFTEINDKLELTREVLKQ